MNSLSDYNTDQKKRYNSAKEFPIQKVSVAWRSIRGSLHADFGDPNQDAVAFNVINMPNWACFGVFDGHGPQGEDASSMAAQYLVHSISTYVNSAIEAVATTSSTTTTTTSTTPSTTANDSTTSTTKNSKNVENCHFHFHKALADAFENAAKHVESQDFAHLSGTTATVSLLVGNCLYVATIGDSSAYLARKSSENNRLYRPPQWQELSFPKQENQEHVDKDKSNSLSSLSHQWEAISLSPNHRVSNVAEAQRVQAAGGFIQGDYVVSELNSVDSKAISVTRALGDLDIQCCGVIPNPEILTFELTDQDKFMILATDGLWDAHEGSFAPEFVIKESSLCENVEDSCTKIIDLVTRFGPLDDCTVLLVEFLR